MGKEVVVVDVDVVVIKECVVVMVVVLMVDMVDSGEQTRMLLVVMEDMVMEEDMEVVMGVLVVQEVEEEAEGQRKGIASSHIDKLDGNMIRSPSPGWNRLGPMSTFHRDVMG